VFRPGHNLPTKTLEELAEEEYHDAMHRQAMDQEAERLQAMEDPESEEVLERERKKKMAHEDWADYVPKGRGITKNIWGILRCQWQPLCDLAYKVYLRN